MTVTLEPELENEVRQQAAAKGQEADTYLQQLIQKALHTPVPTPIYSTLTPKEFKEAQEEMLERAKARNLPFPNSDFRREDIYDDEEGW